MAFSNVLYFTFLLYNSASQTLCTVVPSPLSVVLLSMGPVIDGQQKSESFKWESPEVNN